MTGEELSEKGGVELARAKISSTFVAIVRKKRGEDVGEDADEAN